MPIKLFISHSSADEVLASALVECLNQGMVAVADLLVAFTILTNDGQDAVVRAALSMLSAAEKR